jgi:hypothetical protein
MCPGGTCDISQIASDSTCHSYYEEAVDVPITPTSPTVNDWFPLIGSTAMCSSFAQTLTLSTTYGTTETTQTTATGSVAASLGATLKGGMDALVEAQVSSTTTVTGTY